MTEQSFAFTDMGAAFQDALRSMHASEAQPGSDTQLHDIDDSTRIAIEEGMALYSLAVGVGATSTMEVGLAYGFSTAYILAALDHVGGGRHVSIDPYQQTDWVGIGQTIAESLVAAAPSLGSDSFVLLEERSDLALGDLERAGCTFGLTFIDGYHRFDDVLVDFTLAARMCPVGGVIVLHDMWLDSIGAVASFLRTNRPDMVEVDTGCDNLFAVRRIDEDRRDWTHFHAFPMR